MDYIHCIAQAVSWRSAATNMEEKWVSPTWHRVTQVLPGFLG